MRHITLFYRDSASTGEWNTFNFQGLGFSIQEAKAFLLSECKTYEFKACIEVEDDFFAATLWSELDLESALNERNYPATRKNMEIIKSYVDTFENLSVEYSQEILYNIVSNEDRLSKEMDDATSASAESLLG